MYQKLKFFIIIFAISLLIEGNHIEVYAEETSQGEVTISLQGKGTEAEPYHIWDEVDLQVFRDVVNSGYSFENQYVRQEADIDLSGIANWTPIGVYGSGKYFEGTYNGNGYVIRNLTINLPDDNAGFFGILGGNVLNLGMEGGRVTGYCVGGIASHAKGDNSPMIINCYTDLALEGFRVGGIVDNFTGGMVAACWSRADLEGEITAGICSYNCSAILDSYSETEIVTDSFTGGQNLQSDASLENAEFIKAANYALGNAKGFADELNVELCPYVLENEKLVHKWNREDYDIDFKGTGTEADPYIIESAQDLCKLQAIVNKGETFYGCFFTQKQNIDMKSVSNWSPIGNADEYLIFSGTYNGDGHYIENMKCVGENTAALFGAVNGTILNLGIESGEFSAENAASMVMSLFLNGKVLNCYNKAIISGSKVAGICFYNDGQIVSSWSQGNPEGENGYKQAFQGNGDMSYCFSSVKKMSERKLNRNVALVTLENKYENNYLYKWCKTESGFQFDNSFSSEKDLRGAKLYSKRYVIGSWIISVLVLAVSFVTREFLIKKSRE